MEERAKRPKQEAQRAQRCGVLEKGSQPLLTSYGVWAKLILFLFQWWRMRLVSPVYVTLESAVVSHGDDAVSSVCIFNFLEWILGLWGNENSLLRGLFATLSVCTQTVWLCTSACRLNDCTSVRLLAYRLWSYGCLVCTCVCTDCTSAGELRCWRECSLYICPSVSIQTVVVWLSSVYMCVYRSYVCWWVTVLTWMQSMTLWTLLYTSLVRLRNFMSSPSTLSWSVLNTLCLSIHPSTQKTDFCLYQDRRIKECLVWSYTKGKVKYP